MKRKRLRSLGRPKAEVDRRSELLQEISDALIHHPDLKVTQGSAFPLIVEGRIVLESSLGIFDAYEIRIELAEDFPLSPPRITETGGRIPRDIDRHSLSALCLEVWPVWLATTPNPRFQDVLDGPIRNFLLSQTVFELTGAWPFGERAHGDAGTIDAVSELLNVDPPDFLKAALLVTALYDWPKGHNPCRCGSGRSFRTCHRPRLQPLRDRLPREVIDRLIGTMWEIHQRREARKAA